MIAYHFTGSTLRDGRPVPAVGEWLVHDGPIKLCEAGLHASRDPFDALRYAPGPLLHKVQCLGDIIESDDKIVCRKRKILATVDMTELLRSDARQCALDVIHLWDAPEIVREYLTTGDESKRDAARSAARSAVRDGGWPRAASCAASAAWNAAWSGSGRTVSDAARSAACDAANAVSDAARSDDWVTARVDAGKRQRRRFNKMVRLAFQEVNNEK